VYAKVDGLLPSAFIPVQDRARKKTSGGIMAKAILPSSGSGNDWNPSALVIGAGIAGIQAALDIADAGYHVYLVERDPAIGGRMAQLDKTFPTLDCSACILTPKTVDVARHPNVKLMTYTELANVESQASAFRVTLRKKPRYINTDLCTGCGLCAEACRMHGRVDSEFDAGMGKRSPTYVPFPQAVPLKYTIDPNTCLFLTRGVCGKSFLCKEACEAGAIDFDQAEESIALIVDAIIVATGFDPFDAGEKPELGYAIYDNVITGLEFERLASASGPTKGQLELNGRRLKEVVFIQCVGSRDKQVGNPYCSRVCCMYTAKQAHLVHEKLPDASVTVLYIDIRAFGKGFEEFYDRVREEGAFYRRANPSEIIKRGDKLIVRAEDTLLGRPIEIPADLVVLAVGLKPRSDAGDLAQMLNLKQNGFFTEAHSKMDPVGTNIEGIFLAGCCQGPKDIPDTVAHGKAAAAAVIVRLARKQAESQVLDRPISCTTPQDNVS
jgi:heterodisulfide reductase subunit A